MAAALILQNKRFILVQITCSRGNPKMAGNNAKIPRYKFQIPSADEVDNPVVRIEKGTVFSLRKRPADEEAAQAPGNARSEKLSSREGIQSIEVTTANATTAKLAPPEHESVEGLNNRAQEEPKKDEIDRSTVVEKKDESKQLTASKASSNSIIVSARQRGNPVLKHIRNVAWEYGEIVPDYVLGQKTCALFLSLRYHNFNQEYIHERLKQLGGSFELRILLVLVDVKDPHSSLKELSKICILANCTLILSWSNEEAGRYLETYKVYENKPADVLQERVDGDYQSKMIDCLTSVKSVNKTDAVTLMANFGSLQGIVEASREEISLCPGFGPQKAERLHKVFHEPFIKGNSRLKKLENAEKEKTSESTNKESPVSTVLS